MPIRKTIIIGLGGTGTRAALYLKREFINRYEKLPSSVRIVCFDTNTDRLRGVRDKHEREILLVGDEFTHLTLPLSQAQRAVREPRIRRWFPEGEVRMQEIMAGTQQNRTLGRLVLFAHVTQEIYPKLQGARRALGPDLPDRMRAEGFTLSEDERVDVQVIGSLSGGTGSGMMLDIACLCRRILAEQDRIFGFFLLPAAFAGQAGTRKVHGNGYAALKELDVALQRTLAGAQAQMVDYGLEEGPISWGLPPFNLTFLIGGTLHGEPVNEPDDVLKLFGPLLFAHATELTEAAGDVRDTCLQQLLNRQLWHKKRPYYCGLGATVLELPVDRFARIGAAEKILKLIDTGLLTSDKNRLSADVDGLLTKLGLREEGADDVIDFILPQQAEASLIDPCEESEPVQAILKWKEKQIQQAQKVYDETAKANYQRKLDGDPAQNIEGNRQQLEREIQQRLDRPGGVDYAFYFVSSFITRLEKNQSLMEQEKAQKQNALGLLQAQYPSDDDIKRAARGWFNCGRLRRMVDHIRLTLNQELKLRWEITRRDYAIQLFAQLLETSISYRARIKRLQEILTGVRQNADNVSRELRQRKPSELFEKSLEIQHIAEDLVHLDGLIDAEYLLRGVLEGGGSLLDWVNLDKDKAFQRLEGLILPKYLDELGGLSVEQVLQRLRTRDETAFYKLIRDKLIEQASPLWECSFYVQQVENFFLLGFRNPQNSHLQELDAAHSRVPLGRRYWADTEDPHRLMVFKYVVSVPAYALQGAEGWQKHYIEEEDQPESTFHIHKTWMGTTSLPDLFPEMGDDEKKEKEQLLHWALACAEPFGVVQRTGRLYILKLKDAAKEKELGNKRTDAFENFKKDTKLFAQVKNHVEEIQNAQEPAALIEALHGYVSKTREELRGVPIDPDTKLLLDQELQTIEQYARDLPVFQ